MAIIGLAGGRGAGRSTAASALALLGYERAGFRERLRYMITMAAGLSEELMTSKADEPFPSPVSLQPFHIDGMVRLANAWRPVSAAATTKMREAARHQQLQTPREVMDFVFELFTSSVGETFWLDVFRQHAKPESHPNLVVEDVSTTAERDLVRELEGLVIGIERPGVEGSLPDVDLVVHNNGSVTDLQDQLLAAVIGRLRGVPMRLAEVDGVPATAVEKVDRAALTAAEKALAKATSQAESELAAQRQHYEQLRTDLDAKIEEQARQLAELAAKPKTPAKSAAATAKATATAAEVTRLKTQVAALTSQLEEVQAEAQAQAARRGAGSSAAELADAASLIARLALALGYRAGLAKDGSGRPVICADLPSGQVAWPTTNGAHSFLPRYDQPVQTVDAELQRDRILTADIPAVATGDRGAVREDSHLAGLNLFIDDLVLLAEGCKVHRAYRARRPPIGDCQTCWSMWEGSERLARSSSAYLDGAELPPGAD